MKYIPMIWEKNNTRTLELLDEEIQMKNLDMVSNKPLKYFDQSSSMFCDKFYYPTLWR